MELWAMTEILRILIVDDEPEIREEMAEYLAGKGYRVIVAGDGPEGLAKFQADPCDLAITDMKMPGMAGAEVIRRLREIAPGLPVVVLTGHYSTPDLEDARRAGAGAVLHKPVRLRQLHETLKMLLAGGGDSL